MLIYWTILSPWKPVMFVLEKSLKFVCLTWNKSCIIIIIIIVIIIVIIIIIIITIVVVVVVVVVVVLTMMVMMMMMIIIVYKITKIVRALWLAERSVCMRVCKHGCDLRCFAFHALIAQARIWKVLVIKTG